MIRNAVLIVLGTIAAATAAASIAPANGQLNTPSASLSYVNTFSGAAVAHPRQRGTKLAGKFDHYGAGGCFDSEGRHVPCLDAPVKMGNRGAHPKGEAGCHDAKGKTIPCVAPADKASSRK